MDDCGGNARESQDDYDTHPNLDFIKEGGDAQESQDDDIMDVNMDDAGPILGFCDDTFKLLMHKYNLISTLPAEPCITFPEPHDPAEPLLLPVAK